MKPITVKSAANEEREKRSCPPDCPAKVKQTLEAIGHVTDHRLDEIDDRLKAVEKHVKPKPRKRKVKE